MLGRSLAGLDYRRLRLTLGLFFLALALPAGVLVHQTYDQLKWESFHQYRTLAEELTRRIDSLIDRLISDEESRSFADYGFLVVTGDPAANYLQPSALAAFPVVSRIPGLVGYFQVDAKGVFDTPLLPEVDGLAATYGISPSELDGRRALEDRIRAILGRNRLVQERTASATEANLEESVGSAEPEGMAAMPAERTPAAPASGRTSFNAAEAPAAFKGRVAAQAGFDRLDEDRETPLRDQSPALEARNRMDDRNLRMQRAPADDDAKIAKRRASAAPRERSIRKERSALPEPSAPSLAQEPEADAAPASTLRVSIFESELDPFRLSLLDSGHFVLYRKVWREGQRSIQGALIEQEPFLRGTVEAAFRDTVLSRMSDLAVAYRGAVLRAFSAQVGRDYLSSSAELSGDLLHRARLSAPAGDLELIFSISLLPAGPGARVLGWTAASLVLVLCGGFFLMDRLGRKQIDLARQQQDFVSAVSHELKTPLTSIRMYAEMLHEGWTDEERRRTYYAFIREESERLTRLINNVLQLARLTRNELRVDLQSVTVAGLMEAVQPKIASLTDRAGFALDLEIDGCAGASIRVDADSFTQILINLVDNAVKFARDAERREIRIDCRSHADGQVLVSVRDYGPGVPRDQMKKIFRLFYRSGNELTRETVGTGIGLALVRELTLSMGGRIDLVNAQPGAEFRLTFAAEPSAVASAGR